MKKDFNILLILCAALVTISCSKTKSYTDMLKDEKKAIERLIDENDFEILKDFPEDSVFKENQFVELENGVYLNIIDKGTNQRAKYGTKMLYRCVVSYPMDSAYIWSTAYCLWSIDNTIRPNYGPHSNGTDPYPFTYGDYASSASMEKQYLISEGLQEPLKYVGDKAKVKLIVPFKRGTYVDQGKGQPVYYEILEYIFEENL
ncbi:DUF4827 family protein [Parabacteroides sp. ZJ-118]|uniref:DUF4827 family protein n=1 Tax=Parabacteroides sp. ZJ-118 TaxID=2709398 RepID=UPI0013EDE08F|nr:DUF4827 family protein [Parabacteroides sp. ZJ-118]